MNGMNRRVIVLAGFIIALLFGATGPAFGHVYHNTYVWDALTFDPISDAHVWMRVHNWVTNQWSDWEECGVVDANCYGHSFGEDPGDVDEWEVIIQEEDGGGYNGYTPIDPDENPVSRPQTVYTLYWYVLETP